jgi:hypothetical protein
LRNDDEVSGENLPQKDREIKIDLYNINLYCYTQRYELKKILFTFVVVFSLIALASSKAADQYRSNALQITSKSNTSTDCSGNVTNISIENIVGGVGLTGVVRNNGGVTLNNLTVSINMTTGSFVRLKTTSFSIQTLAINESTELRIQLFGIGLGKLTPLPEISIIVKSSESVQKEVQIVTMIFGPFTKIITTYIKGEAFNGYTLFSPEYSKKAFLMDKQGKIVHTWESSYIQGLGLLLLENGDLLRTALLYNNPVFIAGGATGGVELFNWNGSILWHYNYSNDQHCLHHDIEILPNGHILMVGWEYKTAEEAIAAGRNPDTLPVGELWPDHVIEVERTGPFGGTIVWEWHTWDHLIQDFNPVKENYGVVKEHPELIDINYGTDIGKERADWNHINSIDYNEKYDQILLSAHNQHEIWIIDHSTTTEESAGHTGGNSGNGGDLLYRYGNPETYGAGTSNDQRLFGQHDAQWIPEGSPGEGNILIFNNGEGRPDGQYSSVDELIPPVDDNGFYYLEPGLAYGPKELVWSYTAENPFDFYAGYLSSAQRLPNGNTLVCDGDHGEFFEVTSEKKTVWKYHNTIPNPIANQVFKILCYPPDYPGLNYLS